MLFCFVHGLVMEQLDHALQKFYEHAEPLGLAFWSETDSMVSFGLSANRLTDLIRSSDGFLQWHIEEQGISVYVSAFGRRGYLIAQFEFQPRFPPPLRPWLAFARLAAAVARILETPGRERELPPTLVAVPRPNPRSPKDRGAEAPFDEGARR